MILKKEKLSSEWWYFFHLRPGNWLYISQRITTTGKQKIGKIFFWSGESAFLDTQHKSMAPSYLLIDHPVGGVMVWRISFWHILGLLSTSWATFKHHSLSVVADHVHVYHLLMAAQSWTTHKTQIISNWCLVNALI